MQRAYRVAMVGACPFPTAQGSQVLLRQLSEALAVRGHAVHIVTYHLGDLSWQPGPGLQVHRIPWVPGYHKIGSGPAWGKLVLDALLLILLLRVVRSEAIEVIHAHNYEALLVSWLAGRLCGLPVIYHSHNVMAAELPSYFRHGWARWLALCLARLLDSQLPRRADMCVAMSAEAASFFRADGIPEARIRLVPPGIDCDEPVAVQPALVRKQYGLEDGPLVIYAGNLDQYQHLALLFRDFRRVRAMHPSAQLLIATHSPPVQYQDLVDRMGQDSGVRFVHCSSFAEMRTLLLAADVAVCPRIACFGFPIKLLNYMAAGKAVVVAEGSAKGIRHMENGYVVHDGEGALADGIACLLQDPVLVRRLGAAARATVERCFGWPDAVREVECCYAQLVGSCVEPLVAHEPSFVEVKA